MKFYVISDNADTRMGLRLAGMDGVVAHSADEVRSALEHTIADAEIGVVLVTEKLIKMCGELIYDIKLNRRRPLIIEIPDRHGNGRAKDFISNYVRDAIGVKF